MRSSRSHGRTDRTKARRVKDGTRSLRFEALETRALLTATTAGSLDDEFDALAGSVSTFVSSETTALPISLVNASTTPGYDALRYYLEGETLEGGETGVIKDKDKDASTTVDDEPTSQGYKAVRDLLAQLRGKLERGEVEEPDDAKEDDPEEKTPSSPGYDALRELLEDDEAQKEKDKDKERDPIGGYPSDAYESLASEIEAVRRQLAEEAARRAKEREEAQEPRVQNESDYVVIFSGGSLAKRAGDNYTTYYETIVDLYDTLTQARGIDPSKIFILYADGDTTGKSYNRVDLNGKTKPSDMTFATSQGSTVLAATYVNLSATFAELASQLKEDSHLLFYTFDHGDGATRDPYDYDDYLVGWGERISGAQVRDAVYQIDKGNVTLAFAQCFAGGVLDDFFDPVTEARILSYTDSRGIARVYTGSARFAGCAATNHYEYSTTRIATSDCFYEGYAQAFVKGLLYEQTTTGVFEYAQDNDLYASTSAYANNRGAYETNVEHPWYCGETFDVFSSPIDFETDRFDPNEFASAATVVDELDVDVSVYLKDLYAEPYGDDWYRFSVPDYVETGDRLYLSVNASGLDVQLYYASASNGQLQPLRSLRGSQVVELLPEQQGLDYYLRVSQNGAQTSSIEYSLSLDLVFGKQTFANPTSIVSAKSGEDSLTITWNEVAESRWNYVVAYRKVGEDAWSYAQTDQTTFTLENVCGAYQFKVRAPSGLSRFHGTVYSETVTVETDLKSLDAITFSVEPTIGAEVRAILTPTDATARYQWRLVSSSGEARTIEGATSASYVPTRDDLGYYLVVRAEGIGEYGGIVEARSSDVVKYGLSSLSLNAPSLTVGSELTTTLAPTDATARYQWYCSDDPYDESQWTAIPYATGASYATTYEVIGKYIRVKAFGVDEYGGQAVATTQGRIVGKDLRSISIDRETFGVGNVVGTTLAPEDAEASYQWYYSDSPTGSSPIAIEGATSSQIIPTSDLIGKYLVVVATGLKEHLGSAVSAVSTTTVAPLPLASIELVAEDYVVGTPIGTKLDPSDATVTYQWFYRADAQSQWTPIEGAIDSTFTPSADLIGRYVAVEATGVDSYSGEIIFASSPRAISSLEVKGVVIDQREIVVGGLVTTTLTPRTATVEYQWYYSDSGATTGYWTAIKGATKSTYVPTAAVAGKYLAVKAIGVGEYAGKTAFAISASPAQVKDLTSIAFAKEEFIVGNEIQTILTPANATVEYQWSYSSTPNYVGYWTPIKGATRSTYTPTADLVGKYLAVTVKGKGSFSGQCVYVIATRPVGTEALRSVTIDAKDCVVGKPVTTTVTPNDANVEYQWYRADLSSGAKLTAIEGATGAYYVPAKEDVGKYLAVKVFADGAEAIAYASGPVVSNGAVATNAPSKSDLANNDDATSEKALAQSVGPTFEVETQELCDGRAIRLSITASEPIVSWTIDWGDGQIDVFSELRDSLVAGKIYASQEQGTSREITLTLVSAADPNAVTTRKIVVANVAAEDETNAASLETSASVAFVPFANAKQERSRRLLAFADYVAQETLDESVLNRLAAR